MISLRPTFRLFLTHLEEIEADLDKFSLENLFQQSFKFICSMSVLQVRIIIFCYELRPVIYGSSSESLSSKIEEMSNLHVGHSLLSFSHGSIQSL